MKRDIRFTVLAVLIGAGVAARGGLALAAPTDGGGDEALVEARERYGRGLLLYKNGDSTGARAEFERAYSLAPTYRLLYDLALASEGEGDRGAAIRYLRRYLAEGGAGGDPSHREKAQELLTQLRARVALVTIHTNVTGDAGVTVDEQPYGEVSTEPLVLLPGARKIWVTQTGYYPSSQLVLLKEGDAIDVSFDLQALPRPRIEPRPWWRSPLALPSLVLAVSVTALVIALRKGRERARAVVQLNAYQPAGDVEAPEPTPAQTNVIDLDDTRTDGQPIDVEAYAATDIGRVKPSNEDSHLADVAGGLFVVADGIGGFAGGGVASATAVDAIRDYFAGRAEVGRLTNLPRRGAELASAVFVANQAIREKQRATPNLADMGCTCVAALVDRESRALFVVHVGDSRVYRLRAGRLKQLTTDHTMAELGMTGRRAGHLSRALGSEALPKLDVIVGCVEPDDIYLLCCDGLNKMLSDDAIAGVLQRARSPRASAEDLVDAANRAGGLDNITTVVVHVARRP